MEEVITPLGMNNTAPSLDDSVAFNQSGYDRSSFSEKIAKPYDWSKKQLVPVDFNYNFGPAAGLMSSVADLAKYAIAIDERKLLKEESWEKMFTPYVTQKQADYLRARLVCCRLLRHQIHLAYGLVDWLFVTYHQSTRIRPYLYYSSQFARCKQTFLPLSFREKPA